MAKITRSIKWDLPPISDSEAYFKAEAKIWAGLQEDSDSVDLSKSLVGALIRFPVADGYAVYIVNRDKPLSLTHVALGDGWSADPILLRGLRKTDIIERVERDRNLKKLFAKK